MASQTSSRAIDADLGLYVHVPFCEHVCPYCDFDVIGVRRLAQRDEVVFAAYVTGTADYSIIVECRGAHGLDAFVRWLRADAGVARTETKLLLRVVAGQALAG